MAEVGTTDIIVHETGWVMLPATVRERLVQLSQYKQIMAEGEDYGIIPGTQKPTLYQPGADTLCIAAGLRTGQPIVTATEDWDKPFFHYNVLLPLYAADDPKPVAWGVGSANSREERYAYRWIPTWQLTEEEKERAKAEGWQTRWRVSKGKRYLFYRAPNEEMYSLVNTLQKMAVKRAYISATLRATGAHRVFTQDVEDIPSLADTIEGEVRELPPEAEGKAGPPSGPVAPTPEKAHKATKPQLQYFTFLEKDKPGLKGLVELRYACRLEDLTSRQASEGIEWAKAHTLEQMEAELQAKIGKSEPLPLEGEYIPPEEEGMLEG